MTSRSNWAKNNPEKRRISIQKYNYSEKGKAQARKRYLRLRENPEYLEKKRNHLKIWRSKRIKSDVQYRLMTRLRARMSKAVRTQKAYKKNSFVGLLGISIAKLRTHLEKQFQSGMTWENYGKWHIDHRLPLASFDLTKRVEQERAFHFSNLQPLWAEDNQHKSAKVL